MDQSPNGSRAEVDVTLSGKPNLPGAEGGEWPLGTLGVTRPYLLGVLRLGRELEAKFIPTQRDGAIIEGIAAALEAGAPNGEPQLLGRVSLRTFARLEQRKPASELLSDTEVKTVELVSLGFSAQEIADQTIRPKDEIEADLANIMDLLDARSHAEAVCKAIREEALQVERLRRFLDEIIQLPGRQRQILGLSEQGYNQSEIAGFLKISVNSVKRHKRLLYRNLQAKNMPHAVRRKYEECIV